MESPSPPEMLLDSDSTQQSCQLDAEYDSSTEILLDDADTPLSLFDSDEDVLFDEACGHLESEAADSLTQHSNELLSLEKDREWVTARVEGMFERIVVSLMNNAREMSISLISASTMGSQAGHARHDAHIASSPKKREISFLRGTVGEAWRFSLTSLLQLLTSAANALQAVLIRILEVIHGCLVDGVIVTKRDIYYRQPDLFVKQSVVDRYVDDIARTLGIQRASLNVTAAAKGIVAGNLVLRRADGTVIDGTQNTESILIPHLNQGDVVDAKSAQWILVIEKEATFTCLRNSSRWPWLRWQGILVTAKGYPDIASRGFLRRLADSVKIPIFGLVDYDPDGIAILSTYKYGSSRLAHENISGGGAPSLNLPELCWLGVRSDQIMHTTVTESFTEDGTTVDDQRSRMRLTRRDRAKASRMLETEACAEGGMEPEWRRELQTMLMLNIKAEMQIVDEQPGGLPLWLENELGRQQGVGEKL